MGSTLTRKNPRGVAVIVVEIVILFLATVTLVARFWARRLKKIPWALNDYMAAAGLIFTAGLVATEIIAVVQGGVGQHQQNLSFHQLTVLDKCNYTAEILWICANTSIKISVLDLYRKIFRTQRFIQVVYGVAALTFCAGIATVLKALLICRPIALNWDKSLNGVCGNLQLGYLATGILNMATDVIIVLLPIPMIWSLQMKPTKKLAMSGIFCMGFGICIFSALRLTGIESILAQKSVDFPYIIVNVTIFSALEPTLGVINACLCVLQPVFAKVSTSIVSSWSRRSPKSSKATNTPSWRMTENSQGTQTKNKANTKHFQRLYDHLYPLGDMPFNSASAHASPVEDLEAQRQEPSGIKVTTDWGVHSKTTSSDEISESIGETIPAWD